ncbi:MAG: UDP-galactopyranose mutase [Spirochaetaceae bacterium]|jgi:UDP-galactopyranose mutase|nr:UDP-galactopyranose mutase [Spirochaetaceae bacterium]
MENEEAPEVIVVGAGFSGAVFARVMADAGMRVIVLERRAHIAGNMYDEKQEGVFVHRYGPHFFHTNNQNVFDFLSRFSRWTPYRHRVLGKINGKFVPLPFNFTSLDMLFEKKEAEHIKEKLQIYFSPGGKVSIFELLHHDDVVIKEFGNFVYENVFVHYTEKQWGISIDNIDKSTINRVPVVIGYDENYFSDSIQFMPAKGYQALFTALLRSKKITVRLNTDAKEKLKFDFEDSKIYFNNVLYNGIVFFSGALDELFDNKYGQLPYRSLDFVFETIESAWYQDVAVVNYPNDEKWTRITEFKHCMPQHSRAPNRTIILKEYPHTFEKSGVCEPYYPVINAGNAVLYQKYADDARIFQNLILCGRLAEYKYYNMDEAAARSLALAKNAAPLYHKSKNFLAKTLFRQVTLYGIIGSFCAGLDSVIFILLRKLLVNAYLSNFISVNIGILSSFLLNTFINFKTPDKLKVRALRFFCVGYGGLTLSMCVLFIGKTLLGQKDEIVKIFSVFIVASFQFTCNKLFTFRRSAHG